MKKEFLTGFSVRTQRRLLLAQLDSWASIKKLTPAQLRRELGTKWAFQEVVHTLGLLTLKKDPSRE